LVIRRLSSPVARYGLAASVLAGAALARAGLVAAGADAPTTTVAVLLGAVMVVAMTSGVGPAVATLLLAVTGVAWLGPGAVPASSPAGVLTIGVFLLIGATVVWFAHLAGGARLLAERAEHRLQTVLDSITDGFVAVDFSWRYTYVNAAAQAYFGKTESDLIGRACWDVFPQALGTPFETYLRQVMEQREPLVVELPATLRTGRLMQITISPTAEGISITFRDVTEEHQLREASLRHEERFHRAMSAARMAAWEYDAGTNRVTYSASAPDVLGVPIDQLPIDRAGAQALIDPDDVARHIATVRAATRSAEGEYSSEFRLAEEFLAGRAGPIWIEDRGRILLDATGKLLAIQGVMQDVTARRFTEARVQALNQDLRERIAERQSLLESAEASREAAERSSRAKDEFLAVLSHELRSPMQSVLGWVQVLRSASLDAETAGRALDTIERNLRQQTQLINDMLDVSRIVTGKLVFHLATLPLASVVRETVDELRPLAEAKALRIDLLPAGDLLVVADRERVRQVVSNLFTNAVKFTPAAGTIEVRCREVDGMAQLDVHDSGDGIAADLLPTIFERFRQADTSSTRRHEGLGLGLSITKYIVDHLGGSIEAASDGPGRGARFTVRLPLAPTPAAGPTRGGAGTTRAGQRRLDQLDVLVVDDHLDTVELIAFVLRRQGAVVRTATSAQEALEAWRTHPAQILVTDLSMPGMDGYALIGEVRKLERSAPGRTMPTAPAVALSGLARADDRQRALAAGFVAHLAKPVEPDLLVETIEAVTARATPS
jgi:PAS domain S-box-containing protein